MDKLRVSMVCMNSHVGDWEGNTERSLALIRKASAEGSDIVCFPEMSLTGYSMPKSFDHALSADSPFIGKMIDATAENGICAVFGFAEEGNRISQAVADRGKLVGIYRKTHPGESEKEYTVPGDSLPVFRTAKAVIGIQLCIESHFPEISGTYAYKGADIILMPHASGLEAARRRTGWNKILPARAYDNTVFVAACNQVGDNGLGVVFGGGACIYGHRGDLIAEDYSGECMLTADLDGTEQERLRTRGNTGMRDQYYVSRRHPELYFR